MVEGASSFRCTRAPARTLAISWAQTRHADDYPPAQPAVPRGCRWGGDQEERDAACASPFLCHPSARAWDRYKTHPSAFRTRQIGYDGALHARRHGHDRKHQEPARPAVAVSQEAQEEPRQEARYRREQPAGGVTGGNVPHEVGGRGYLPRPWTGMATGQCRPGQPRATQGDVGDRELPHGRARRPCRTLREPDVRPHADLLQLLSYGQIP